MKPFSSSPLLLAALVFPLAASAQSLANLWTIAPDSVPYVTSGTTERGLAYNPVTDHLLLVSRAAGVGGLAVEVLNSSSGAALTMLNTAGISGGYFPLDMIGVADDGAIYTANLTLGSATTPLTIYRWASESAAPTVAYSGNPGASANLRFGDTFKVRGAGVDTQILLTAGAGATSFASFTTMNGTSFSAQQFSVTGINQGDMRQGLAFGSGNTLYAKTLYGQLRCISYDPASGNAAVARSFSIDNNIGGPIGVSRAEDLLVTLEVNNQTTSNHAVDLINLGALLQGLPYGNSATARANFPASNITVNGTGEVAFTPDGSRVFVLESQNGMMGFDVIQIPEPAASTLALLAGAACLLRFAGRKLPLGAPPVYRGCAGN